jgi:hypothetical protein
MRGLFMNRSIAVILLTGLLLIAAAAPAGAEDDPVSRTVQRIQVRGLNQDYDALARLARTSDAAVAALARLTREGRERRPGRAAIALADAGHAKLACELLDPLLSEGGATAKLIRAWSLYQVGREYAPAFDALARSLQSEDVDTRRAAARALC